MNACAPGAFRASRSRVREDLQGSSQMPQLWARRTGVVLASRVGTMRLTFLNSPAKLVYLAEENDLLATAWQRFQARHAELLLVRRADGRLVGADAEQLEAFAAAAVMRTVGSLALKQLSVVSHRSTLAQILAELSRGAEGVVLADGPEVVSVVLRRDERASETRRVPADPWRLTRPEVQS